MNNAIGFGLWSGVCVTIGMIIGAVLEHDQDAEWNAFQLREAIDHHGRTSINIVGRSFVVTCEDEGERFAWEKIPPPPH